MSEGWSENRKARLKRQRTVGHTHILKRIAGERGTPKTEGLEL